MPLSSSANKPGLVFNPLTLQERTLSHRNGGILHVMAV